jgi:UDP-3-O-[3-hydroxymyristoyl] glucosamine N-acyltransferase
LGDRALSVAELANELGRELAGDGAVEVSGVAALDQAGPDDLTFVRDAAYLEALESSQAAAVVLPFDCDPGSRTAILSPNPALDFARAVERLCPPPCPAEGVDARALVDDECEIDPTACVAAGASIGRGTRIGARTVVHPNATLYSDVEVGADSTIHAGVVIREACVLGDRVMVQPGAVIGGDGFGHMLDEAGALRRVPQVGRVIIGDDVEIGANTTVDRATLSQTVLRDRVKLDNLIQIGHNSELDEDVVIAAQSGVSGSVKIGRGAILMARAGVSDHVEIGRRTFVGARSGVVRDVPDHTHVYGSPHMEARGWHRAMAALKRLPDVLKRIRAIERELGLRGKGDG